jgi:FtsP/CotA-like multicopper oxidase with cupredoxin domain
MQWDTHLGAGLNVLGLNSSDSQEIRKVYNGDVYGDGSSRATKGNSHFLCRLFLFVLIISSRCFPVWAQASPRTTAVSENKEPCSREPAGSTVEEPRDRRSQNGSLTLTLTIHSSTDPNWRWSDSSGPASNWSAPSSHDSLLGHVRYCYTDEQGNQAPTLRIQPGDTLILNLKNEISLPSSDSSSAHSMGVKSPRPKNDPCSGGSMTPATTNLHFHGLAIPPVCHQDETLKTLIQPGDPPFEYRVQIPKNQPPGLYWYHPHVHGFSEEQLLGGASGALIVEGMGQAVPRVAGLPERVFVIRDEKMPDPLDLEKADPNRPTKQLSVNYIPVRYPKYVPAVIKMKPLERQFWRVVNGSADTYLELSLLYDGKRQNVDMVALDGVPLHYGEAGAKDYAPQRSDIFLPPASRAEFIVTGPPAGVSGTLQTARVFRGAGDDNGPVIKKDNTQPALRLGLDDVDPLRPIATLIASTNASTPGFVESASVRVPESIAPSLSSVRPVRKRKLYFSEKVVHPDDPKSPTLFFITQEGGSPAVFNPDTGEPSITVHQGEVEDWIIENRSQESHVFHVHQLHFLVVGSRGIGWQEATLRDTVNLPAWDGFRQYPSVTLRMDFRDPRIVGIFPFHCHIAQHSDGGMMGTVRVEPAAKADISQ